MTTVLNVGQLDPGRIHISRHALERYMERRGWQHGPEKEAEAERAMRWLLLDVAHQRPPIFTLNGYCSRRFVGGGMAWIVAADFSTLITFYPIRPKSQKPRRYR